jgi:hypothetical protein
VQFFLNIQLTQWFFTPDFLYVCATLVIIHMKKLFTIALFIPVLTFAQLSISNKNLTVSGNVGSEAGAQTTFRNISTSAADTSFTWRVLEYTLPTPWQFGFCDPANCTFVQSTTTSSFKLDTGAESLFKADPVFLEEVAGTGVVKIVISSTTIAGYEDTITFTVTALPLSVKKVNKHSTQLKVFPNPAKDVIQVEMSSRQPATIEVYNVLGAKVKTITHKGDDYAKIDINDLPKGVYLLRINDNGQTITKQFQKVN